MKSAPFCKRCVFVDPDSLLLAELDRFLMLLAPKTPHAISLFARPSSVDRGSFCHLLLSLASAFPSGGLWRSRGRAVRIIAGLEASLFLAVFALAAFLGLLGGLRFEGR